MVEANDLVALLHNRPHDGLTAGAVGAVVHCYQSSEACEVEFLDEIGRHKCIATVPTAEIMRLNWLSLTA